MAKFRQINTKFWDDPFIITLNPKEKMLFLYFLTNPSTELCGVYEITLNKIQFHTELETKEIINIINKFSENDKIYYINNWIYIKNFIKHHNCNPNMKIGIDRGLNELPEEIRAQISKIQEGFGMVQKGSEPFPPCPCPCPCPCPLPLPKREGRFAPPSLQEVSEFIKTNNYTIDPEQFINFYESKGWLIGKSKMKSWQAAVRTWVKRNKKPKSLYENITI